MSDLFVPSWITNPTSGIPKYDGSQPIELFVAANWDKLADALNGVANATNNFIGSSGTPSGLLPALTTDGALLTILANQAAWLGLGSAGYQLHAGSASPQWTEAWFNVKDFGAQGNGSTDDTSAIQSAVSACPAGGRVYFPAGNYVISGTITVPDYVGFTGDRTVSTAYDSGQYYSPAPGSVLTMSSGGTNQYMVSLGIGGSIEWMHLNGAQVGLVGGVELRGGGAQLSYAAITDCQAYGVNNLSGSLHMAHCIIEYNNGRSGGSWGGSGGITGPMSDSTFVDVHVQNIAGYGFDLSNGQNVMLVGCRADLCTNGYYIDTNNGGSTGYRDGFVLVACGTQRNAYSGLVITNSGSGVGRPVVIAGCHFGEDGSGYNGSGYSGGPYAGIYVGTGGLCNVKVSGTSVNVGTIDYGPGCPQYGLMTAGSPPAHVGVSACTFEYPSGVSGSMPFYDSAAAGSTVQIDPTTCALSGGQIHQRIGVATLSPNSGGTASTATVSSPWINNQNDQVIQLTMGANSSLTNQSAFVSSRAAGQFVITSTYTSSTANVYWAILT